MIRGVEQVVPLAAAHDPFVIELRQNVRHHDSGRADHIRDLMLCQVEFDHNRIRDRMAVLLS